MRKAQKKQAEDFVRLLADAHNELKKYIENKNYEPAADLLGECQRGAIELGGLIEKTEGEDQHTVLLLEEYCESIYQLYEQISGNQEVQANKLYKRLRQALIRVENSIKNDIKARLEIVFMPYKASMWDSLESIWEAAKEDPDCDAYVVPIPYYDRNSDYSLGQCHYEGEKFPDYVEIVDYHTYHLENRRPDIIYIHNPYDEHNYVTSVDPQYYSYKLKDYTEQLVYVPYCIYDEPAMPDSKATIEFCSRYVTSGILNADKVIVQSENFRRALISALLAYRGMDREFWEKKVIALGSPKYDKVTNEDMNKLYIPESWERLIKRPDGSRKRVIFYNTSLNALLQYGEQMNRKIRSVLRFFYENRETCILLWRPHPLVQATIESMRPELWEEYKEITDTYRKEGWGIYDDTPDFHAAFAVSDAYYGDYSSLLLLYQGTWKPVLRQNADILDYRKRFVTDRLYYDGEYVWGTAREFNGLFRINPETFEIKYMGQFPDENPEEYRLFYGIAQYGGKLYFCPHNAKYIGVYDKVSKDINTKIMEVGNQAVYDLGLTKLEPELVELIGKLKYRSSYGQNALQHSIEVANLTGLMASELGENINLAKRAGLLHDIGKAIDFEIEGSHVEIGSDLAHKYHEDEVVINAIESHHGDKDANNIISVLVEVADTLSAARPGARNDTMDNYMKRLAQLEEIGNSFPGVDKTFAVQAGREIRVMVKPDEVDDAKSYKMARDIKERIESEMQYPGTI